MKPLSSNQHTNVTKLSQATIYSTSNTYTSSKLSYVAKSQWENNKPSKAKKKLGQATMSKPSKANTSCQHNSYAVRY